MGGVGFSKQYPVEKFYRDCKIGLCFTVRVLTIAPKHRPHSCPLTNRIRRLTTHWLFSTLSIATQLSPKLTEFYEMLSLTATVAIRMGRNRYQIFDTEVGSENINTSEKYRCFRYCTWPVHAPQHMTIYGLSPHRGTTESRNNLKQIFIFQIDTFNPHGINERFLFN